MRTIENCNLLFQKNEAGSCFKVSQKYVIHHRGPECNGATMHRLIKEINGCLQKCSDRRLKNFSDKYNVDDFFNIASFQDRVSSREDSGESGGRGLPLLIRSLERQADTHLCYVISGKNVIWFKLPYMEYNKDEWVGFNSSKNFLSDIPAEDSLGRGETFVSGTAFNLNFAMMKRRGQD